MNKQRQNRHNRTKSNRQSTTKGSRARTRLNHGKGKRNARVNGPTKKKR